MSVYVSKMLPVGKRAPACFAGRSAYLMADTDGELEAIAHELQLNPAWRHGDHYDLTAGKRWAAIALGAVPTRIKDLVKLRQRKRKQTAAATPTTKDTKHTKGGA